MASFRIGITDSSVLMNKGPLFIRQAIKNRTMPGSYTEGKDGKFDFFIPRYAFYDFLGITEEEAEQRLREHVEKKQKATSQKGD